MNPTLSVVVCTHNPRADYLNNVLKALQVQTLPFESWELLLIDNASEQALSETIDLTWHPQARHIRENQLGLTPARLRGIKESSSETLIFVDDDNVLDSDYLEIALKISHQFPFLGSWGGQIRAEFEIVPPEWAKPHFGILAIREFDHDRWSNLLHQHETTPCGAGMCVRRKVAEQYIHRVLHDPRRMNLDRKGKTLMSCGDTDLAFTACDIGLGTGQFKDLKLTHLIPETRLEEEYLLRLTESMSYSLTILDSLRGKLPNISTPSWKGKIWKFYLLRKMSPIERRFHKAYINGITLAAQQISHSAASVIKSYSPSSCDHP
jgi:glycosyltransferase involved in cell wall biosynthesis